MSEPRQDRQDYLDAWRNTGNEGVISETRSEIERFKALKDVTFKASLTKDGEGVRLAFLAAECWYTGAFDAQVGREKRSALAMFKRIREARLKVFGKTQYETIIERSARVPLDKVVGLMQSGIMPTEILSTLN